MIAVLAALWGCGVPEVPSPPAETLLHGRWEPLDGNHHCLVLEPDGRFELTERGDRPELVITGTWRPDLAVAAIELTPERIHTERYISSCRKHVYRAADHEQKYVLGALLVVGETTPMRVVYGGERLGLCGTHCTVMRRVPADEAVAAAADPG